VLHHRLEARQIREEGFDDAFERLFWRAYRVSFQIVRNREDAEDVAMDTMARALRDWKKLDPPADGWVARVAANRSIDLWRRVQRRRNHDALGRLEVSGNHTAEELALRQAVAALPKRQREVLALPYFLDMNEQEIATSLGCSTGSVKQHASRGLAALRRQLNDDQLEEPSEAAGAGRGLAPGMSDA
jgi:RNA polymerase sigma factor (sigma-70 family)